MNISVNMQTGNYINYMIQRYIQSDYSPLIEIWKQSVIHTHDFLSKEDYELILSKLPEYFSSVDMYVYRKESRIAAFMGVSVKYGLALYISCRCGENIEKNNKN